MEFFEIVELDAGASRRFEGEWPKEKLVVCEGRCRIREEDGREVDAERGTQWDRVEGQSSFEVFATVEPAVLLWLGGRWGEETGGCGVFTMDRAEGTPQDKGDPVDYPKETNLDCHFHDCDEFWIIYRGCATVMTEGKHYEVSAGDCVAIGMGHHHDMPLVQEKIHAVYFETTMEGLKRGGHLWNHTHGQAKPQLDRV